MKKIITAIVAFSLPAVAFAQNLDYVNDFLRIIQNLIRLATPIIIGLALLFFLYGLMRFILSAGDEEARAAGKKIMIWGIVVLFVMVSIWGIVELLQENLDVDPGFVPTIPATP